MSKTTQYVPHVIKAKGSITMYLNGESMTVEIDHPNYSKIVDALKSGTYDKLDQLVNISRAVTSYGQGKIDVKNGEVFYAGKPLHSTLTNRILAMMNEGFQVKHMLLFLENLMSNPSFRAVNETYTFLENHGLPITEDGCFLAYKAVRNNYTDMRTGTFDNHVGKSPSMPRNQVDEDYEQDCSSGLHVGSLGYVIDFGHFSKGAAVSEDGNRLLIVKVNPRDVVSVPKYASHTKMRVATYTVVDEIKDIVKELDKVVYTSDAKVLAPDRKDDDFTASQKPEVVDADVENEFYLQGFDAGDNDNINGDEYGYSRDYDRKGNYLKGYNDGYNSRDASIPFPDDHSDCAGCETAVSDADREYADGLSLGEDDFNNGFEYQENLSAYASESFKDGYRDGFNGVVQ
jgi:hypothetical protein